MIKQIKHKKVILLGIIAIIICIFAGLYIKKEFAIKESIENYHAAETCEKNENYQQAYELYSLVIPDDLANFQKAKDKKEELNKRFEINKIAAADFEILQKKGEANSLDDLESIQVNINDSMMSCMIDGIGYIVYKGTGNSDKYQQAIIVDDTYCIIKYEAEKEYGGWFSSDINMINQDTSLATFKTMELMTSPDLISEKLIKEYIENNQNSGQ